MAMGAMVAIREAGLSIPHDMAVMGFDDIPTARLVYPALSRPVRAPTGCCAAEMLLERLNGNALKHGRSVEMPYQIVECCD